MKRFLSGVTAGVLASAAVAMSVVAMAATVATDSYQSADGEWVTSSAVLRLGPNPYVHTNSSHAAVNVTGVSVDAQGDLWVYRNVESGERIGACVVEEDETISRLGIQAGCSGGGGASEIRLYRNGTHIRADSTIFGTYANLWFYTLGFVPN